VAQPSGTAVFEAQLDSIISDYEPMRKASQHIDLSDLPKDQRLGVESWLQCARAERHPSPDRRARAGNHWGLA
jgi:hypothetical protein